MKILKTFEKYNSEINDISNILYNYIEGCYIHTNIWIRIVEFFKNKKGCKYIGKVWKSFFFEDKKSYDDFLEKGTEKLQNQFVYSCTKNYDILDKIIDDLGTGYGYYIIVELQSTKDNCLMDLNKVCEKYSIFHPYEHEEEILLFADKVKITKENIINTGGLIQDRNTSTLPY